MMMIYFINFSSIENEKNTIKTDDIFEYEFNLLLNINDKIEFVDLPNSEWQKKVVNEYKTAIFKVIDRKILLSPITLEQNEIEITLSPMYDEK